MNEERDERLRDIAGRVSETVSGLPFDLAVGGVLTFLCVQCDLLGDKASEYAARKLREIADVLDGGAT